VRLIKFIAINLLTFTLLVVLVNWACGIYLKNRDQTNARHTLPNYKNDRAAAVKIFADYSRIKHEYEPFVGWKCLPYEGETLTIGKDGERTHIPPDRKSGYKKVVRFFGGSTMWGEGADGQHTIPAIFNQLNPDFEVTNHAQLAYNSRQELDALITMYSKDQKADIVIFYDGVNDAAFLCPKEITELPAHRLVPMYRDNLYAGKIRQVKGLLTKTFTENIMKVVNKFRQKDPQDSPYDCISEPGKAEEIAELIMKNWEMAHEVVSSRGGQFIAILQPAAFIGKPRTDHLKLDAELGQNFAEVYRHIRAKISDRNHSWIYDLTDKFDGDEYIYIDFCHVSPNGNKIIAQELTQVINRDEQISNVASLIKE